jgi:hypothetical protein
VPPAADGFHSADLTDFIRLFRTISHDKLIAREMVVGTSACHVRGCKATACCAARRKVAETSSMSGECQTDWRENVSIGACELLMFGAQ